MAMNSQLLAVVQHIESERGVSREIVLQAIEQAISQAARKNRDVTNDLRVVIDRKDLSLHVFDTLVASDEDTGPGFISIARATRANHGKPVAEGETIEIEMPASRLGRIAVIFRNIYDYMDEVEIGDDFNPESLLVSDEEIQKEIELKNNTLKKVCERAFYIWLYPNHKLTMEQVKEILKPYVDDDGEKATFISNKLGEYLGKCIEIRDKYNQEQKNLKAQANK